MPLSEADAQKAHMESIGRLFLRAQRDFQARMVKKIQSDGDEGISPAHLTALSLLSRGKLRVVDLAEQLKITKQSASDLIRDLEARSFVERQPDPRDKRAAIIHLTPAAEAYLIDKMQLAAEIDQDYIDLLGEVGFAQLVALLTQVVSQQVGNGGNDSGE
ncbi:MAG: MarR family transcriptional regulator [Chloroflexota bacterium]